MAKVPPLTEEQFIALRRDARNLRIAENMMARGEGYMKKLTFHARAAEQMMVCIDDLKQEVERLKAQISQEAL